MVELSRRFFLGGAIALVAAQTFKPSLASIGNMPTIYGRGDKDDSAGFNALFANEPVLFNDDEIGVESHQGIIFYKGRFRIDRSLSITQKSDIAFQSPIFLDYSRLAIDEPLAIFEKNGKWNTQDFAMNVRLALPECHNVPLFLYKNDGERLGKDNFDLKAHAKVVQL